LNLFFSPKVKIFNDQNCFLSYILIFTAPKFFSQYKQQQNHMSVTQ